MSDFYLMTRAAYAKLSKPVAKGALRLGLTPDAPSPSGAINRVVTQVRIH